ncbi:MAG: thioredoxin-disulfide reductase [Lachnospiraceae bacterium]|nr:thioredoxin-disulfide reductase [Lachnospiraceae bacterium]
MYDVVIIGAGPAGLSASVYAKRAGLNAVTFEQSPISGGQVVNTYDVDNYLGFHGISGLELSNKFKEHADALGCKFVEAEVTKITPLDGGFVIATDKGEYRTYSVVVAMGANHSKLGVPGEEELAGMGVSYCATCDGAFFKGKTVAVVGGGDVAVEDAIFLARGCEKVYLVHRRDTLRAAKMLQDKLMSLDNVEIVWDTVVDSINGEDQVEGIDVTNKVTGEKSSLKVDGVFVAVGILPENQLVKGLASLDEKGYVMSGDQCITATPGLFVAGDLRTKKLRQIVTAVADGANVITSVEAYLLKKK